MIPFPITLMRAPSATPPTAQIVYDLNADLITGHVNGQVIATGEWNDSSSYAAGTATSAFSSGIRPAYASVGPSAQFTRGNGTSDGGYIVNTATSVGLKTLASCTIMMVWDEITNAGGAATQALMYPDAAPSTGAPYLQVNASGLSASLLDNTGTAVSGPILNNAIVNGNRGLVTYVVNGASSYLRTNGGNQVNGTLTGLAVNAWRGVLLGGYSAGLTHYGYNGKIYRYIVFSLLSSGDQAAWEAYLKTKYGIS